MVSSRLEERYIAAPPPSSKQEGWMAHLLGRVSGGLWFGENFEQGSEARSSFGKIKKSGIFFVNPSNQAVKTSSNLHS
jgi:hypothetical protein